MLFICKKFMFSDLTWKKKFAPGNPPFLYSPDKEINCGINVYDEDNLYNAVSIMLEQHCIRILFSQCCPNTSETTLHKKCWLKTHRHTFAGKPAVSNMPGSLLLIRYFITDQSWVFLFNVREFSYKLQDDTEQTQLTGPTFTGAGPRIAIITLKSRFFLPYIFVSLYLLPTKLFFKRTS